MPLNPAIIAGIIQGGTGLINNLLNRRQSNKNTSSTHAQNLELAEYQYSQNLEQWNRQNEYNTPEAQMKRYKAAGLNENLIYGQGSSGNAQQSPQYVAPKLDFSKNLPVQLPEMLSNFQNFSMKDAQIKNIEANTKTQGLTSELKQIEVLIKGAKGKDGQQLLGLKKVLIQLATAQSKQDLLKLLKEQKPHQINKAKSDAEYARLRATLKSHGIEAGDNIAFRFFLQMMEKFGLSLDDMMRMEPKLPRSQKNPYAPNK